MRSHQSPKF